EEEGEAATPDSQAGERGRLGESSSVQPLGTKPATRPPTMQSSTIRQIIMMIFFCKFAETAPERRRNEIKHFCQFWRQFAGARRIRRCVATVACLSIGSVILLYLAAQPWWPSFPLLNESARHLNKSPANAQSSSTSRRLGNDDTQQLLSEAARYCNSPVHTGRWHRQELDRLASSNVAGHRVRALLVVFRHGDRMPLTRLDDSSFCADCSTKRLSSTIVPTGRDWSTRQMLDRLPKLTQSVPAAAGGDSFATRTSRRFYEEADVCQSGHLTPIGLVQLGAARYAGPTTFLIKTRVRPRISHARSSASPRTLSTLSGVLYGFLRQQRRRRRRPLCRQRTAKAKRPPGRLEISADFRLVPRTGECPACPLLPADPALFDEPVKDSALLDLLLPLRCWSGNASSLLSLLSSSASSLLSADPPADLLQAHNSVSRLMMTGKKRLSQLYSRLAVAHARPLLLDLANRLLTHSEESLSVSLFSGHDNTLEFLLHSLGIWDGTWPRLAANLAFELLSGDVNSNPTRFRLMYNGRDLTGRLTFCADGDSPGSGCAVSRLMEFAQRGMLQSVGFSSYEALCQSDFNE
uniref:Acid phosphatase n=1 Tax=Macrostomum lignano TaxID=282301 RepID=A0A1I8FV16_9PLAT